MTDYTLSKLFYDLHNDQKLAAEYRAGMAGVLARYELKPEIRTALMNDDVAALSPLVNPYLLRFYFQVRGMPQPEFIARLTALGERKAGAEKANAHG